MTPKDLLTWAAIAMFGVSAFLWFTSTRVKVSAAKVEADYQKAHGLTSGGPAQIVGEDGSDFFATIERQTQWSRWAAMATGVALVLQAVATALDSD